MLLRFIPESSIYIYGISNSGKTYFFNKLTHSNSKEGNYFYTTLYPNVKSILHNKKNFSFIDIPAFKYDVDQNIYFFKYIKKTKLVIVILDGSSDWNLEYNLFESIIKTNNLSLEKINYIILFNKTKNVSKSEKEKILLFFKNKVFFLESLDLRVIKSTLLWWCNKNTKQKKIKNYKLIRIKKQVA